MTKLLANAAVAILLAAAVAVVSVAPASSQQPDQPVRIEVIESGDGFERVIDVGKKGFSSGDYVVSIDALVDRQTQQRVGRVVGKSTLVKPQKALFLTEGTFEFEGGSVTAEGLIAFGEDVDAVLAVTGGTGDYATARGTVSVEDTLETGEHTLLLTFELTV